MKTKSIVFTLACLLLFTVFAVPAIATTSGCYPPCSTCEECIDEDCVYVGCDPPCSGCYNHCNAYCDCVWGCGAGNCCNGSCCSNTCCNNICCSAGQICCGGVCCDPVKCCDGTCCKFFEFCCEGTSCCDILCQDCIPPGICVDCYPNSGEICTYTLPGISELCGHAVDSYQCLQSGHVCGWKVVGIPQRNATCKCCTLFSTYCVKIRPRFCYDDICWMPLPHFCCPCDDSLVDPEQSRGTRYVCP